MIDIFKGVIYRTPKGLFIAKGWEIQDKIR